MRRAEELGKGKTCVRKIGRDVKEGGTNPWVLSCRRRSGWRDEAVITQGSAAVTWPCPRVQPRRAPQDTGASQVSTPSGRPLALHRLRPTPTAPALPRTSRGDVRRAGAAEVSIGGAQPTCASAAPPRRTLTISEPAAPAHSCAWSSPSLYHSSFFPATSHCYPRRTGVAPSSVALTPAYG